MPFISCQICEKIFYAKPKHLKMGWGKYCTNRCKFIGQKKGKIVKCNYCGKSIYRSLADYNDSKSGRYFCSKSCHCSWVNRNLHLGINHPQWGSGEASYRQSYFRNYNKKIECSKCRIEDDRILVVHHKDGNRKNNLMNNLELVCRNCHYLKHEYNE